MKISAEIYKTQIINEQQAACSQSLQSTHSLQILRWIESNQRMRTNQLQKWWCCATKSASCDAMNSMWRKSAELKWWPTRNDALLNKLPTKWIHGIIWEPTRCFFALNSLWHNGAMLHTQMEWIFNCAKCSFARSIRNSIKSLFLQLDCLRAAQLKVHNIWLIRFDNWTKKKWKRRTK